MEDSAESIRDAFFKIERIQRTQLFSARGWVAPRLPDSLKKSIANKTIFNTEGVFEDQYGLESTLNKALIFKSLWENPRRAT